MTATSSRPSTQKVPPLRPKKKDLPFPLNLYQTAVGKKWVMAVTGIGLVGFVLFHMAGNFKVFIGAENINLYGESLRDLGGHIVPRTHLLWILRFGLIAMFGLHIHSAITLAQLGRASNPNSSLGGDKKYAGGQDFIAANFASRTMRWTGPIVLLYLFFHLADLTWGIVGHYDYERGDVYHNLTESLSFLPVALIYIVATIALSIHLFHGVWSMFQSLGINSPKYNKPRRMLAAGIAGFVLLGNLSLPVAALTGIIDSDKAEPYAGIEGHGGEEAEGDANEIELTPVDDVDGGEEGEGVEGASDGADGSEDPAVPPMTAAGYDPDGEIDIGNGGEEFRVNEDGVYFDRNGNRMDADGNRINADDEFVDIDGNVIGDADSADTGEG